MRNRLSKAAKLTAEQRAVGQVMIAAVREYSESHYCAGWRSDIEHSLWDEVVLRREDAYERTCARLNQMAGHGCWRRPRRRSVFAEGLRLLSERFGVWFCYEDGRGERVLALKDWLPLHEAWIRSQMQQRLPYEKIWEYAHWKGLKAPKRILPMPQIKLPPVHSLR